MTDREGGRMGATGGAGPSVRIKPVVWCRGGVLLGMRMVVVFFFSCSASRSCSRVAVIPRLAVSQWVWV